MIDNHIAQVMCCVTQELSIMPVKCKFVFHQFEKAERRWSWQTWSFHLLDWLTWTVQRRQLAKVGRCTVGSLSSLRSMSECSVWRPSWELSATWSSLSRWSSSTFATVGTGQGPPATTLDELLLLTLPWLTWSLPLLSTHWLLQVCLWLNSQNWPLSYQ